MLQRQHDKQLDPRLLISFNILKENFSNEFIKRMVKDFVANITDEKERSLLKYISLINAFDLECRPIPSSAFDSMMVELFWAPSPRRGSKAISNRWENKLSNEICILLNETSKPAMGHIHSLHIINPLLSKEILLELTVRGACFESEALSDVAINFMNRKDIFSVKSIARENLLRIVKDVLKKRGEELSGALADFSPLIQEVVDKESKEKAAVVLETGFVLTNDPFVAQQLARVLYMSSNWEKAKDFIKRAITLKPDNSYLWDTYGRIYEQQLIEESEKLENDSMKYIVVDESIRIIQMGIKGMQIFRQVQSISEKEKTSCPNNSGFFGELQMIIPLLRCLNYVDAFQGEDELIRFLRDPTYIPADLSILANVDGENYLEELKNLGQYVERAMNHIEDELVQLGTDVLVDAKRQDFRWRNLLRIKKNLNKYFGESTDSPPETLQEADKCQYRRRRIFRLAGNNLRSLFDLRWTSSGEETLIRVRDLAHKNVETQFAHAHDYMTLVSVNLALVSMNTSYIHKVKFDDMVTWSKMLYETRAALCAVYLEPYLFLTMFNWPRKNTRHCLHQKHIEAALRKWKEAYNKKYPRQCDEGKPYRKKDTTLFFLSSGSDMASIYTTHEEHNMRRATENRGDLSYWRQPEILRIMQRFQGVLLSGGTNVDVQLQYGEGRKCNINISTSRPIQDRKMWNQQVFFVIGFSWIGPKAFDITLYDPTGEAGISKDDQVSNPHVTQRMTTGEIAEERLGHRSDEDTQ
jgi:tetratricopeptide (TPR) repeat protein